jgi:hypothetical protein
MASELSQAMGSLVAATVGGILVLAHVSTLRDPNSTGITRTLWRFYSARWISPFAPETRLRVALSGYVVVTLMCIARAVWLMAHMA